MLTPSRPKRFWLSPKMAAALLAGIVILGYSYFQFQDWLRGPELKIEAPANYSQVDQGLITVSGRAERIAHLFLNGRRIFTDEAGTFAEALLLAPGYNIIVLETSDRFGRQLTRRLELVYLDDQKN